MDDMVRRIFVEKKKGFDIEAHGLYRDLKETLGIENIESVRIVNRYDIQGINDEDFIKAGTTVFSEPPVDKIYGEELFIEKGDRILAVEYLPGQYDQRADSASQCVQIITGGEKPAVKTAKLIVIKGTITDSDMDRIKNYCVNPVESREASMDKPFSLESDVEVPHEVETVNGFIKMGAEEIMHMKAERGFAMSLEDLLFCRDYFKDTEKRNPSIAELKVIDTYWSDHCRHTTFLTRINDVQFEENKYTALIKDAYEKYLESRKFVYGEKQKDVCLMDIATIAMKEFRKKGMLDDLEVSEEINACSIEVDVDIDGRNEKWLVMFKNETHNHPTEIEPFGGAATCLGGAIRDPLSGRSYVYQAMRVTGCGDPRKGIEATLLGKLPQRKITTGAAQGYSSYGNQIGLSTGQVAEIYDEGYVAKRMEIGAVIGAAPRDFVVRKKPEPQDVIVLLGGRTGRDGCGGATGSSKEHTEESLLSCGAEVQKGNPVTERKIQRLFRDREVSLMIKKCNDFGAGGVSVAIGELADGLDINLNAIPKKYEGLDGTELAISESQERMALVLSPSNVEAFIKAAANENLEATPVAVVKKERRLRMLWNGRAIVDIARDFLDTNGVTQNAEVKVTAPGAFSYFDSPVKDTGCFLSHLKDEWIKTMEGLDVCSQKGLGERFDSTIGAGTVLMPFGGKNQLTPQEGMAAKIPVLEGDTSTATLMSFGYNPKIAKWSPFHGALYAVVEAVAKITAMGADFSKIRLTLQEYFEKLGKEPSRWGKPFSALLGAFYIQQKLGIPAIGGKDSMSGTFKDMDVPPTLVAFAVNTINADNIVSAEFKRPGSRVVMVKAEIDEAGIPETKRLIKNLNTVYQMNKHKLILSAHSVRTGGIAEAVSKMCLGNGIGFEFNDAVDVKQLFMPQYGSIIIELSEKADRNFKDIELIDLGFTNESSNITVRNIVIELEKIMEAWVKPLENVFPTGAGKNYKAPPSSPAYKNGVKSGKGQLKIAKPRILIPVFPGTNCEYDTERAFTRAGGLVDIHVISNLSSSGLKASIGILVQKINSSQIVMLPGGFSAGDEPEGSGKFIAAIFKNHYVSEAVTKLLNKRDGLMLGICNGFQALVKLGLVPFGEIRDLNGESPALTFNKIGRHVSCMVRTKIVSACSPWLANTRPGDIHTVPVSHGEGRFVAPESMIADLMAKGQVATQYVDMNNNASYDISCNPNGSMHAIEGMLSPDGRIFGKMGHSERIGKNVAVNVPGEKDQGIFKAGVDYYG